MSVLATERLTLRQMTVDDAEFVLELLNDPAFIRFIGDRSVRTVDDARQYILNGPISSYDRYGFGLWIVELKAAGESIGMCGLLKRETLDDVDIGFALLPRYRMNGYAAEAASAVLQYGTKVLGLNRIVAIANPDNSASLRLLENLGLRFERFVRLSNDEPEIKLLAYDRR